MPELPEVESIRKRLDEELKGKRLLSLTKSRKKLRKPLAQKLNYFKDSKVQSFSRWGKKMYMHLETIGEESCLEVSLGMSGTFLVTSESSYKYDQHDHLRFDFGKGLKLVYHDPRRFGWVTYFKNQPESQSWDPILGTEKQLQRAHQALKKTTRPLYSFLMDQTYVAGLGNIYVQEALFRAGLKPLQTSKNLSSVKAKKLFGVCREILQESIELGGCTLKDHKLTDGSEGKFQNKLQVYGLKKQEPCTRCGAELRHQKKPRTLTWCPACQK